VTRPLTLPRLHVVTDDAVMARPDLQARARDILDAGGAGVAVHIRGPRTDGRALYDIALDLLDRARGTGTRVLVNDRVDVALAAGAHGCHLGERSLAVADARTLVGPDALLGASAHDVAGVERRTAEGADFVFVGTIYSTPSHPDRSGLGSDGLQACVAAAGSVPVLGIGGVTPERATRLRSAGAWGVATIRGVWDAADAGRAVEAFLSAVTPAEEMV